MEVAEIDVVANTKKASSQIEELKNQIENLSKEVVESNKKTEDALEQLKKPQVELRAWGLRLKPRESVCF